MIGISFVLLLPALLGVPMLWLLWKDIHASARFGYGYLVGLLFTTAFLWLWGRIGLTYDANILVSILLLIALLLWKISSHLVVQSAGTPAYDQNEKGWMKWVWWILFTLLLVRFSGLLVEVTWRPLYPWDAWMNWAPKGKVWFGLKEWVEFVDLQEWPSASLVSDSYVLGNPLATTYPPFVPLVQFWMALGIGEWRDNLINLPWWLGGLAFGMAFYGQLRTIGLRPLVAMFLVYLLFSIPYLNTHIALSGYAELWMSAFYCAAVMALINWSLTGRRSQFILLILMGVACVFIKRPGLIWAMTLIMGIAINLLPARLGYLFGGMSLAVVTIGIVTGSLVGNEVWLTTLSDFSHALGMTNINFGYHAVGEYFAKNMLVRDNWHLLGWLILFLLLPSIRGAIKTDRLLSGMVVVLTGLIFIFAVFFLTDHYRAAIDSTTLNRAIFHLLPALFYFVAVATAYHLKIVRMPTFTVKKLL